MSSDDAGLAADAQVVAVRFGTTTRPKSAVYYRYGDYGEPDTEAQLDYFFWLVRLGDASIVVDSGFAPPSGERRGATTLLAPKEAFARVGIRGEDVAQVVVTHFHYDHIGNLDLFPNAELVVGAREYDFYTGPLANRLHFASHVEPDEIAVVTAAHREGRVTLVEDRASVAPGVTVVTAEGHAPGQLIVHVERPQGDVVLASDAVHLYEELEKDRPFSIFVDLPAMYATFEMLRDYQRGGATVVPGHDPQVATRFPTLDGDAAGIAYDLTAEHRS